MGNAACCTDTEKETAEVQIQPGQATGDEARAAGQANCIYFDKCMDNCVRICHLRALELHNKCSGSAGAAGGRISS